MSIINYSIIIPHKNIPDLLQRCLNSIPRRNDIQIIVVDDNSDKNKVDFSHFPGLDDPYVEVYLTKEGRGAGYARNVGLEHAKGKWLIFADSDDFFSDNLNKILDEQINNYNDIIYCLISSVYTDTLKPSKRGEFVNDVILDALENNNLDCLRYKRLEPWAKIIRRELVIKNKIKFDETIAANDLKFSILTGYYANRIVAIPEVLYCLTTREGSLAYTISKDVCEAKFKVIIDVNNFFYLNNLNSYRINIFPYIFNFKYLGIFIAFRKLIYVFFNCHYPYILIDFIKSFKNYYLCKVFKS